MKHLFTAIGISALMTVPAMADFSARLSDLQTTDVTAAYRMNKIAKTPCSRASEDDQEWKSLGLGLYRDDIFTVFKMPSASWSVEIMESVSTPGCYRIVNPFGSPECPYFGGREFECADLVIHAENPETVYMEYVELKGIGIEDTDEEGNPVTYQAYLCDIGGYYTDMYAAWGMGPEDLAGMGIPFGTFKNGCITFEANAIMLDLPEIDEQITVNSSGLFRISLPGAPDYDLMVTTEDSCLENGELTANYRSGKDVAAVKYLVVPGWKQDCNASMRNALVEEVADNGITASDGVIKTHVPFGVHSLVAVAFDAEGNAAENSIMTCYGRTDDAANWKSIGTCIYSESFLSYTYMDMECDPYQLEIEESTNTPGFYRLVNPYGEAYPKHPFFVENEYLAPHGGTHYLMVDASDPERVMIEASPIGIDAGDGEAQLFSITWYLIQNGADPDDEEIMLDYGRLADGRITFPGGAIATYEAGYGITRGNLNHDFYIQLPDATGVATAAKADDAEYFTISGLKVSNPTKAGVYIRRNGNSNAKILLK